MLFFSKQVSFSIQSTMLMLKVNVTGRVEKETTGNIIRISLDTVTNREIYFDQLIKIDDEMSLS